MGRELKKIRRSINLTLMSDINVPSDGSMLSAAELIDANTPSIKLTLGGIKFPANGDTDTLYALHSAWYSGDPHTIHHTYQTLVGVKFGTMKDSFWTKKHEDGLLKMHVPLASDIAATSADLLFAEMPEVCIPESEEESDAPAAVKAQAAKAQERLEDIIEEGGVASRLLEGAEACSALGGVILKPTWDSNIANYPILAIDQVDNAIPEFKWGILTAMNLYRTLFTDPKNDIVYRHVERHENGKIFNGLFLGTKREMGSQRPLTEHPVTADLMEEINTKWDGLMIRYIPNMKPNRRQRGSSFGQSDFAGIESMMDSLDEVYTSWMRDIRLARSRIIVPESFLDMGIDGNGNKTVSHDLDRAVFTTLAMDPLSSAKTNTITPQQFAIRAQEHKDSAYELLERIVSHAGYSPQTFGLKHESGRGETGVALNIRERKTYITRQKKWKYWKQAVEDIFEMMLHIDREFLNNDTPVFRPSVKLVDSMSRDLSSLSAALSQLNTAQAVSIDTKVRMLHPDWSEEQVETEIAAIKEEQSMGVPVADPMVIGNDGSGNINPMTDPNNPNPSPDPNDPNDPNNIDNTSPPQ